MVPSPSQINLVNNFGEKTKNFLLGGSFPINFSFMVDANNANGLGVANVVGDAIDKIYMHTSATPLEGNPNPGNGYCLIKLKKSYSQFLGYFASVRSPLSGASINVTTGVALGLGYVITALGNTPVADWHTLGVPASVTPAVGVSFIAPAIAVGTGTGTIQVPAAIGSGILTCEIVGNPSVSSSTLAQADAWILLQFLGATDASTTTLVKKAPAEDSYVYGQLIMGGPVNEPNV